MAVTNMNLGALLTAENLVEPSALEDALAGQKAKGGDLKQHLLYQVPLITTDESIRGVRLT